MGRIQMLRSDNRGEDKSIDFTKIYQLHNNLIRKFSFDTHHKKWFFKGEQYNSNRSYLKHVAFC